MISRLLSSFRRSTPTRELTWDRYRNGYASGPYLVIPNRGGGAIASYQGQIIGRTLMPSTDYAMAYCEGHAAGITAMHKRNGSAMIEAARHSIPEGE